MFEWFKKKEMGKEVAKKKNYAETLAPYQDTIQKTLKPYIEITATKAGELKLWQSKFGGHPYLPKGSEYPKTSKGKYLHLLAQINFTEIPPLNPFPQTRILQFFIDDDTYGLNCGHPTQQDTFRVIYYPQIDQNNIESDFSFLPQPEMFPFENATSLSFEKKDMPVGFCDYQYDKYFKDTDDNFNDAYAETYDSSGHHMGGYAYFTQTDPRDYGNAHSDKTILLLQIDSDSDNDIMWGDAGVANFFISEANLRNKIFTDVFYNWDCC